MMTSVRIATRKSPLAFWQANYVRTALREIHPEIAIELLGRLTVGDKMLATPLNKIGGKGLFVKELEKAILENEADIAVHSIKDMPAELPPGLTLAVICPRDDPRDAFVSPQYQSLFELPKGAIIGTSSLRRKAQILALRPDLRIVPLRGNVGTRLQKLTEGEFDAIILAAAGLKRLGLADRIQSYFSLDEMLPAAGQGAIGIECREKDHIATLIAPLDHAPTRFAILAERTFNQRLGGSCQFPIAAHATVDNDQLTFRGLVSDHHGITMLRTRQIGRKEDAATIGLMAAEELVNQGADALLAKVLAENKNDT